MTKKIICLMLAMLMIVPLLASCSGEDDAVDNITSDASQYTTTLNMWVQTDSALVVEANKRVREGYKPEDVPDDKMLPEQMTEKQKIVAAWTSEQQDAFLQVYAIEDAINDLTKTGFKTRIKLFYLLKDSYYQELESTFAAYDQAVADGSHQQASDAPSEETELIDGIPQLKYPETKDYVIDIFYMDGYERYRSYIEKGWAADMTTLLDTDAVEIGKYIDGAFLNAVKYNNFTYAVPNYHAVGQYTYLMVDKTLLAEYGRVPTDITTSSIYDSQCKVFLDYIYQDKEDVFPIYTDSADGLLDFGPVYYWNHDLDGAEGIKVNKDSFSLFGDVFADTASKGSSLSYDYLLADQEYMQTLALKRYYESNEGYITNDPAQRFNAAACVVKGDWELRHEYAEKGYAYYVMEKPRVTTDDVFSSMFAIGAVGGKAAYANRSMEIIAYLNTNADVRNILQYGVEGVNYTKGAVEYSEGELKKTVTYVVPTSENLYSMDVNKTGNVFLAYPSFTAAEVESMTEDELLEAAMVKTVYLQNKNLDMGTDLTLSMYYNFKPATGSYALDVESIRIINAVSERALAALSEMNDEQVNNVYRAYYGVKGDNAAIAAYLIADFGADITYVMDGETKTVTAESLLEALECMADSKLVDEGDSKPETNDDQKESPNAFYQAWLAALNAAV